MNLTYFYSIVDVFIKKYKLKEKNFRDIDKLKYKYNINTI